MEIFVGNDIIEVSRIANLIENDKFLCRVFSDAEIEYCEDKANKAQNYAARIEKSDNGRPIIVLFNHSEISDNYRFDLSLSHVKEYAVANVVMYSKK